MHCRFSRWLVRFSHKLWTTKSSLFQHSKVGTPFFIRIFYRTIPYPSVPYRNRPSIVLKNSVKSTKNTNMKFTPQKRENAKSRKKVSRCELHEVPVTRNFRVGAFSRFHVFTFSRFRIFAFLTSQRENDHFLRNH